MGFKLGGLGGCCCTPVGSCACTDNGQNITNGCNVTLPDPVAEYEKDDGTDGDPSNCCWNYNGATLFLPNFDGCSTPGRLTTDAICGHTHSVVLAIENATQCRITYQWSYAVFGGASMTAIWRTLVPRLSVMAGVYTLPFVSVTHGGTRPTSLFFCKVIPSPGDVEVEFL